MIGSFQTFVARMPLWHDCTGKPILCNKMLSHWHDALECTKTLKITVKVYGTKVNLCWCHWSQFCISCCYCIIATRSRSRSRPLSLSLSLSRHSHGVFISATPHAQAKCFQVLALSQNRNYSCLQKISTLNADGKSSEKHKSFIHHPVR